MGPPQGGTDTSPVGGPTGARGEELRMALLSGGHRHVLFNVPAFASVPLANGTLCDGVFVADDVGSAIGKRCIGFCVGFRDQFDKPLYRAWKEHGFGMIDVYLFPRELTHEMREARTRPQGEKVQFGGR